MAPASQSLDAPTNSISMAWDSSSTQLFLTERTVSRSKVEEWKWPTYVHISAVQKTRLNITGFSQSQCMSGKFTICVKTSLIQIPGNTQEHFLARWDLILLDFFFCFINTGHRLRQTILNKPQRKSRVFIELCLMTIHCCHAWLSSLLTMPKMEFGILRPTLLQICEL